MPDPATWQRWLVENLLRGVEPAALLALLTAEGVPAAEVQQALATLPAQPAYQAAARLAHAVARSRSLDARARKLAAYRDPPDGVPRRAGLTTRAFYREHVATNLPVVLTDACAAWPAVGRWSPAYLRERVGPATVRVMAGRDADPRYHQHQEENWQEMSMAAYSALVERAGSSNDFYMVASNRNLERTDLLPLQADLRPLPAVMDPGSAPSTMHMWFGPADTRTPLHRDMHPVLLCQVYGRKRLWLIQPREMALILAEEGFYAPLNCEAPDFARFPDLPPTSILEVELAPGEALYIPWDWWHQARALEPSISVALDAFRRPEDV
ncbi:MAG: hypothetical protein JWM80_1501 [Cyanobacteria bacterium RYN_339]|nr:hypothetical protein [Cyanobacteria bacterium RYN_339]